jgi:hypothetical protein
VSGSCTPQELQVHGSCSPAVLPAAALLLLLLPPLLLLAVLAGMLGLYCSVPAGCLCPEAIQGGSTPSAVRASSGGAQEGQGRKVMSQTVLLQRSQAHLKPNSSRSLRRLLGVTES